MANFKVGQRVRIIKSVGGRHDGVEATILTPLRMERSRACGFHAAHRIAIDGVGSFNPVTGLPWGEPPEWLAPLTDPKADAFIESLKKLAREPAAPVDVRQ